MPTDGELREALEGMVYQFAYRTVKGRSPALCTGGLSALEYAFEALGWRDDPHRVGAECACEVKGCYRWVEGSVIWDGMNVRLCSDHIHQAFTKETRPPIKPAATKREKRRGPDGILREEAARG